MNIMKSKLVFLGLLAIVFFIGSCGDKEAKESVQEESTVQEVIVPDTTNVEPETIQEEVIEEIVPQERIIVVQEGEWIFDIARREYGAVYEWRKIVDANKDIIENPNMIYPGQKLVIPE